MRGLSYRYQALPMEDGRHWKIQKVTITDVHVVRVSPAIDWLTQDEAESAVRSGRPFRYLEDKARRRGPWL